jgi:hypothetical protein
MRSSMRHWNGRPNSGRRFVRKPAVGMRSCRAKSCSCWNRTGRNSVRLGSLVRSARAEWVRCTAPRIHDWAALNHPHICAVYDVGSHGGGSYLVLEYVEGETLAARLKRGRLDRREVLTVASQVTGLVGSATV